MPVLDIAGFQVCFQETRPLFISTPQQSQSAARSQMPDLEICLLGTL